MITVAILLFAHFMADFIAQNDWMSLNKSKSIWALLVHCSVYTFIINSIFIFTIQADSVIMLKSLIIFFVSHFMIDAITSKITSVLWKRDSKHWFFVTIGFDQFLHSIVILKLISMYGESLC